LSISRSMALPWSTVAIYVTLCCPDTPQSTDLINGPALLALAVRFGETRLIDHLLVSPSQQMGILRGSGSDGVRGYAGSSTKPSVLAAVLNL
jgi:hypothetical protein